MRITPVVAALTLIGTSPLANSAPMTYDFSGTCTLFCSAIGVSNGAAVSGFMKAAEGFASDGVLSGSELIDFGYTFGNVLITTAAHKALGALALSPDLSIDYGGFLNGITFYSLLSDASVGNIGGATGWTARNVFRVAAGSGSYSPTAVPEPASLALLGLGLAAVGAATRRKVKVT